MSEPTADEPTAGDLATESQGELGPTRVRVIPDLSAVTRRFDYAVPAQWRADQRAGGLEIGGRVRVELHGRRVGGWVAQLDPDPLDGVELLALAKSSGLGPSAEVLALCEWIAHRWAGSLPAVLRAASPVRNVVALGPRRIERRAPQQAIPEWIESAFSAPAATIRLGPAADRWAVVEAALHRGNPLFVTGSAHMADLLTARLRKLDVRVARMPNDWAQAASGAVVVGPRAAVLARTHALGAIVVFDEHDEVLQDERTPTWHARDVAIERAARASVPCVLVSPTPSVEALQFTSLHHDNRRAEFAAWPPVEVIDRRDEPPGRMGLFSPRVVDVVRSAGRVACVLNRKGRSRLLACASCGEVVTCAACEAAVRQNESAWLTCGSCAETRPAICGSCGGTRLKNLRMGVSRAQVELEALVGEPVAEVTAATDGAARLSRVVVGTDAILRRPVRFDVIAFLDIDQELAAPRQRAAEQALALIGRAARLVGPRSRGGRVVVQTRLPDHHVLRAAQRGDPTIVSEREQMQRAAMGWPPATAQAEISGQAAAVFIERLGAPMGIEVRGGPDGRWLVRAPNPQRLADALGSVDRPAGRLRVVVDPARI